MRTYTAKPKEVKRDWFVIDAKNIPIGRLSSRIASILRGKHKTTYTPFIDTGDVVIVINAAQVGATGDKEKQKVYYRHSGYPGGLKSTTLEKMRKEKPEMIIELA